MQQQYFYSQNGLNWNQRFYLRLEAEVHPFDTPHLFRPLNKAYNGNTTFWSTPSPEPNLTDDFWQDVQSSVNPKIFNAAKNLAESVLNWQPNPKKLLFISILRAGVPITEWLCQMIPEAQGVTLSLFVGIGIDRVALDAIKRDFPDRTPIFVDGWTGKGGVAREIKKLKIAPLAVLIDPWGWADFAGVQEDIFCPSACFTGVATLGFSRTFFVDKNSIFSAYQFSKEFLQLKVVDSWKMALFKHCQLNQQNSSILPNFTTKKFYVETDLRVHSNEVCRALINAAPESLLFADNRAESQKEFGLILKLGEQRGVEAKFNVQNLEELKTKVACKLSTQKS
ncbi:MAG: hypothetical protein HQK74_05680 [Desulfamplus sp.]|nr:hypothetical protein [Desulfamplus sp.]